MVFLKDNQEVRVWMNLYLAGRVGCLQHLLCELLAQVLYLQDPECVLADSHETFSTLR